MRKCIADSMWNDYMKGHPLNKEKTKLRLSLHMDTMFVKTLGSFRSEN